MEPVLDFLKRRLGVTAFQVLPHHALASEEQVKGCPQSRGYGLVRIGVHGDTVALPSPSAVTSGWSSSIGAGDRSEQVLIISKSRLVGIKAFGPILGRRAGLDGAMAEPGGTLRTNASTMGS